MQSVYFPSDDEPIEHRILHVEDETNGPRKAREALRLARNYLDGPLGVSRSPNPQIDTDPDKVCIVGSNEYAVYKLSHVAMPHISNAIDAADKTAREIEEALEDERISYVDARLLELLKDKAKSISDELQHLKSLS